MLDLSIYGTSKPFSWDHDYLIRLLSTGRNPAITNPIVLNAFRQIDRAEFVPETSPHADFAYQDKSVDIGYEEVMTNPTLVAKQIQLLTHQYGGNYLHLGAGTGYVTAILGTIAGDSGRVHALERVQWIWEHARKNLRKYAHLDNTFILYRDGTYGLMDKAPYDGILISFAMLEEDILAYLDQLAIGGKIVSPTADDNLLVVEKISEDEIIKEIVPGFPTFCYGIGKINII